MLGYPKKWLMKNYIVLIFFVWFGSCAPEHEDQFPYILSIKRITNCEANKPYTILALDKNLLYPGSNRYPLFLEICSQSINKLTAPKRALDSYRVPLILCRDGIPERDSITIQVTIEQRTSGKRLAFFTETLYRGDTLVLAGDF